ncbi:insulinoma-associated protein 1a [Drosophila nasuta]|uniref:insulinoma-associated protein 1a n=1 Tax=Drosophila nasuta TaxID=42062 RepID=UPI00295F1AAE|nr:insulinoma-associated protein 1a [Drosophila nasuta]
MASVANPPQQPSSSSSSSTASGGSHSHVQSHPHMHSIQLLHNATAGGMPHGLGLLTTVASLPPKYRSRYLNIKTKCEIPLDLSVKPPSPEPVALPVAETSSDVPMATTEPPAATAVAAASEEVVLPQEVVVITEKPITPPQSPDPVAVAVAVPVAVKRKLSEQSETQPPAKLAKSQETLPDAAATPAKPIRVADTAPRTAKATTTTTSTSTSTSSAKSTRNKATRKLKFDEETSSPVSGTIIRPLEDITDGTMQYSNGDIDPKYNIVEITDETKAELAAIKNVIGDYVCRLCRIKFDDAFGLARHRCACIVLLEYRCPECGKQFNCPANLASHRRWHKPKKETSTTTSTAAKKENRNTSNQQEQPQQSSSKKSTSEEPAFGCAECGKKFKRAAYLRKHQQTHAKKTQTVAENEVEESEQEIDPQPAATTTITGSFQTSVYKSHSSSSASSSHSYAGTHEDEGVYVAGVASSSHYDYEADYLSDCSSSTSSAGYGRLQIVEHGLTEEESIAAAALTNLRNCASVIQHTTMAH